MLVTFEVTGARAIDGELRAVSLEGTGTMLSGICEGSVFTFVGALA